MAMRLYIPPPDDSSTPEVCWRMMEEAASIRRVAAVEWAVVRHYLQGCRFFDNIDYETGVVRPTYRNSSGGIPFKYEEILNKRGTEISRLLRLDTSPAVTRRATGLDSLRQESHGQAILDSIYPSLNPEATKRHFAELLVDYGSAGILAYEPPRKESGPDPRVAWEVVPPWELCPLPAAAKTASETAAWCRRRWVALATLKGTAFGREKPFDNLDPNDPDVHTRFLQPGSALSEGPSPAKSANADASYNTDPVTGFIHKPKSSTEKGEPFIQLSEIWLPYHNGRLRRYIVMAGKKVVHDVEYDNTTDAPLMPLGVAIRQEGVGPQGRGFVGPLIPLNREAESAILSLIRNIQNLDLMGLTGIPQSWGVSTEDLTAAEGGAGYWFYDPDPSRPNEDIKRITPTTTGTLPRDIMGMCLNLMDRMSQQPEVAQGGAPGRVDSKSGLQFLYQTSNMPLGEVAASIAGAFGTAYKAILGFARGWPSVVLNMASLRDESLAGVSFDPTTGLLGLSKNSVPDPSHLEVGIRSQVPIDKDAMEAKLNGLVQSGGISWAQYRITARLRGLNIPLPDDAEWQNYRTAVLRCIILFNNGETPGDLSKSGLDPTAGGGVSFSEISEIHLSVLARFMASPEFAMASAAVQNRFNALYRHYNTQSGAFPESMPYPEDAAATPPNAGLPAGAPPVGAGMMGAGGGGPPGPPDIQQMLAMMSAQPPPNR